MKNGYLFLTISGKWKPFNEFTCATCNCTGKVVENNILIDCPDCVPKYDNNDMVKIKKQNIFILLGKAIWFTLIDVDGKYKRSHEGK